MELYGFLSKSSCTEPFHVGVLTDLCVAGNLARPCSFRSQVQRYSEGRPELSICWKGNAPGRVFWPGIQICKAISILTIPSHQFIANLTLAEVKVTNSREF